tara:strand:+ start:237 stop:359 length:123 start_codon:yes stop_codon:yes gene_type:complete
MNNVKYLEIYEVNLENLNYYGAVREDRTPDLTLTKGVLYH